MNTKLYVIVLLALLMLCSASASDAGLKEFVDASQAISTGDIERAREMYSLAAANLENIELKAKAEKMAHFLTIMKTETFERKIVNAEGWFFIGEVDEAGIVYHLYYDTKGNNILHLRDEGSPKSAFDEYIRESGADWKKGKITKSSRGYKTTEEKEGILVDTRAWTCRSIISSDRDDKSVNVMVSTFGKDDYSEEFFEQVDGCPGERIYPYWLFLAIVVLAVVGIIIVAVLHKNKRR